MVAPASARPYCRVVGIPEKCRPDKERIPFSSAIHLACRSEDQILIVLEQLQKDRLARELAHLRTAFDLLFPIIEVRGGEFNDSLKRAPVQQGHRPRNFPPNHPPGGA